ncbi:MAG TPA: hypothetical protein PLW10_12830 [Myxococcota bacterium]|nr:hypothetical protein [Myxococcota bacterium]
MRGYCLLMVSFVLSVQLGCGARQRRLYEGPPRQPEAVSVLLEDSVHGVRVLSIDGESAIGTAWELLPGPTLVVAKAKLVKRLRSDSLESASSLRLSVVCEIRFDAIAGRRYLITQKGSVDYSRARGAYEWDLKAFAVEEASPEVAVGSFACEEARSNIL